MNPFSGFPILKRCMSLSRCVLTLLLGLSARAEPQVRRVQEQLRKRNLFFGEIDCRDSIEVHEALHRYQLRKGFVATGTLAPETLASLGVIPARPEAELVSNWPDGPVLRSDSARMLPPEEQRRFRIRFNHRAASRRAEGKTDNVFEVRSDGIAHKFTSLHESFALG